MQDKDTLLQPLSGPGGCGEDLSFSTEFDSIREARREDDASLAQGDWVASLKLADWDASSDLCTEVLTARSKDLRVAGWYAEAEAKLYSFAGLSHGCAVLTAIIEQYWEHLYPEAEDGDQELRIGTLTWFVARSVELIRQAPLTESVKGNFSLSDQESARAFENAMEKDPDLRDSIPEGKATIALINEAQRNTAKDFYRKLLADLQAARSAWDTLAATIDARLGVEGPSFREIFDAFDAVDNQVQRVAREQGVIAGGSPATADPASSGSSGASTGGAPVAMMIGGAIQHRAQALQQLRQVADFFEQTEPHSPVTYLARKAADWGDMPLHQWLAAVVKDDGALSQLNELLGVRTEQNM